MSAFAAQPDRQCHELGPSLLRYQRAFRPGTKRQILIGSADEAFLRPAALARGIVTRLRAITPTVVARCQFSAPA